MSGSFLCSFVFLTRVISSCRMAPRKGFSPFTRVISPELSPQLNWYILCSKVCGSTPTQYFKRSPVVASFPGDFQRIDGAHIRLQDGCHYSNKKSSNATEIVCSSFGLITTLLRRSSSESSEFILQLRDLLNIVDLSNISASSVDEENGREANHSFNCLLCNEHTGGSFCRDKFQRYLMLFLF